MRIAGIGFRANAPVSALRTVLAQMGGADALATLAEKATAPQIQDLSREHGLPILAVARESLAPQPVLSHSERQMALFGTGSLAEAAALSAAGPGARLIGPRIISADRTATCAIAETETP